MRKLLVILSLFLTSTAALYAQSAPPTQQLPPKTRHVILIMSDGLRWQEVFRGADDTLMAKKTGGVTSKDEAAALRKSWARDSVAARRAALMPFLWNVIAAQGQIYGDRDAGSDAFVTNGKNFSYPGYSETLCGFPDPRIASNDKIPNPNVTVFEWLNNKPAFRDQVAAFGGWDVFPFIFNIERAKFTLNAGWDPLTAISTPQTQTLNTLKAESPHYWNDEPFDEFPAHAALEYMQEKHPRLLFIGLGETDDWAHERRYSLYLESAHRADDYVRQVWELAQSIPEYRGTTTIIFSPDHGRGAKPKTWTDHGVGIADAKYIWIAVIGPDTRALGDRQHVAAVTQSQIAATIAALLGENYNADVPNAGTPLADVLPATSPVPAN